MLQTDYKFGDVTTLVSQIESGTDKVMFRHIFNNENGGVTLLAFKAGQSLSTHTAPAEVMVYVLEGEIEFTMIDALHVIRGGEFMLMGAGVPHSVTAKDDSKVMLIKVKP